jgi:hypothetical protein
MTCPSVRIHCASASHSKPSLDTCATERDHRIATSYINPPSYHTMDTCEGYTGAKCWPRFQIPWHSIVAVLGNDGLLGDTELTHSSPLGLWLPQSIPTRWINQTVKKEITTAEPGEERKGWKLPRGPCSCYHGSLNQ